MQHGSQLDNAISKYVILLDTCFAMQGSFEVFLQAYKPVLKRNHIFVPYKVIQELERIRGLHDDRAHAAESTLHLLEAATKDGIAEYRRDANDDRVVNDAVISRVVDGLLPQRNVLVLTHDANLTSDLYTKTQYQSFRIKDLIVAGVSREGKLFAWGDGKLKEPTGTKRVPRPRSSGASTGPAPFSLSDKLASSIGTRLSGHKALRAGDMLFLKDGSRITLRHVLASGGEGSIYELDDHASLCKVYHQNKLTLDRQEKIELMLTRAVSDPMICWPRAAVYDSDKVFRGFIMPRASGQPKPLGHGLFIPAAFLKTHSSWTRLNSAHLAVTIMQKIKYLHDMNVLVGDINPQNILMQDERTVYFVDCDSYQVEGYPCPVGTVNFTAPEIQDSDFGQFLRTKEHELFSVATLLFMIFMPGKSPYSHQGGEDGAANIRRMHFPYALGERSAEAAPEGPWRLCWSHLTRTMKTAFDQCFHEDHRGEKRIPVERWSLLLNEYVRMLGKQNMAFQGPARQVGYDLSILPENFRRVEMNGEVKPPWGLLTDQQKSVKRLVADANRAESSRVQQRTATAPPELPPYTQYTPTIRYPGICGPSSTVPPYTRSPSKVSKQKSRKRLWSGRKWIIGIAASLMALAGIVGVIWCYWDPIIAFLKIVLAIAVVGVVIKALQRK